MGPEGNSTLLVLLQQNRIYRTMINNSSHHNVHNDTAQLLQQNRIYRNMIIKSSHHVHKDTAHCYCSRIRYMIYTNTGILATTAVIIISTMIQHAVSTVESAILLTTAVTTIFTISQHAVKIGIKDGK